MNELLNKTITVSAKEEKLAGGKPVMKIKDANNLVYSVWKFKQDGTESIAWGQIPDIGEITQIGYIKENKQTEAYGTVTYRTIRTFNKDIGNGVANHQAQVTQSVPQGHNSHSQTLKDDKFFQQLAYEKCCSLWLASLLQSQGLFQTFPDSEKQIFDSFWTYFQAIKADGKKRFFEFDISVAANGGKGVDVNGVGIKEPLPEELPTIQAGGGEDISVEDIPF